jgi:hypothetical protein
VTHARMAIPRDLWNSARHVLGEQVIPAGGSVQPPSDHGQTRPQTEPSSVIDPGADRQVVADSCGKATCRQMPPDPRFGSLDSFQVLSPLAGDCTIRSISWTPPPAGWSYPGVLPRR